MNIVRIMLLYALVPYGEIENAPFITRTVFGKPRVIGGYRCSSDESSFMIAIVTYWGRHICGGSLLSPLWVLTAAHCTSSGRQYACDAFTRDRYVKANGELLSSVPSIRIIKWVVHPRYSPKTVYADIALMRLKRPIHESIHVSFVKLPPFENEANPPYLCPIITVMGWGITQRNIWVSSINLQCLQMVTCSREECVALMPAFLPRNVICTAVNMQQDTCHGDSGGPLMCDGTQMGITSWGLECASVYPAVYTRVDKYLGFINSTMNRLQARVVHSKFILLLSVIISIITFYLYYLYF